MGLGPNPQHIWGVYVLTPASVLGTGIQRGIISTGLCSHGAYAGEGRRRKQKQKQKKPQQQQIMRYFQTTMNIIWLHIPHHERETPNCREKLQAFSDIKGSRPWLIFLSITYINSCFFSPLLSISRSGHSFLKLVLVLRMLSTGHFSSAHCLPVGRKN